MSASPKERDWNLEHARNVADWRIRRQREVAQLADKAKAKGCTGCGRVLAPQLMVLELDARQVGRASAQGPIDELRAEIEAARPYCVPCALPVLGEVRIGIKD